MNLYNEDLEHNIQQLHLLAFGDVQIVEDALLESLERVRPIWWQFWNVDWVINWNKAAQYIVERRKAIDELQPSGDSL